MVRIPACNMGGLGSTPKVTGSIYTTDNVYKIVKLKSKQNFY
jgi:hypothetical protein